MVGRFLAVLIVVTLGVAGLQLTRPVAVAGASEVYPAPTTGSWTVSGHGNGHGHGLSQYGAQGAALAGLNYKSILAFYYQGTSLVTAASVTVRVLLTGPTDVVSVAYQSGMTLTWTGGSYAIPAGATQWRLVPWGTGLALQQLVGSTWSYAKTGLPTQAYFSAGTKAIRYVRSATTSIDYRGTVGALRSGANVLPINRVGLDDYTRGVVPREMPSSWQTEAVRAQSVAARTYVRYAVEHNAAQPYDICDTTNCQVYGGAAQYSNGVSTGVGEATASNDAVTATANQVLTYAGHTIFSQFSAADGGWTVDGGQPYLVAKADPYEQRAGGPWFAWSRSVSAATVAAAYGLARVTQLQITGRDGHGDWGGRVNTAVVIGVTAGGATSSVPVTGFSLASAMGLPHNWFIIDKSPPSEPTMVTVTPADHSALLSWAPPQSSGSSAITGYSVAIYGRHRFIVPATARSTLLTELNDFQTYSVVVWAINAAGEGPQVITPVTAQPSVDAVNAVEPIRLFDTNAYGALTPTHPLSFGVPGHGSYPPGARSVMMTITMTGATSDGVLNVYPEGAPAPRPASIAYRMGRTTSATVAISLTALQKVHFVPSTGSVQVLADQVGYTSATGPLLSVIAQAPLASLPAVPTSPGVSLPVSGHAGIPSTAVAVLLQVTGKSPTADRYLRMWPDGAAERQIAQVDVLRDNGGSNVVLVPIGANGAVRLGASAAGISAEVTVLGYLANAGQAASGDQAGHQVVLMPTPLTASPLTVTPAGVTVAAQGVAGVPVAVAHGLLLQITLSSPSSAGTVRVYPTTGIAANAPAIAVTAGGAVTTTVAVRMGAGGTIRLDSSMASVKAVVEVIGYTTMS